DKSRVDECFGESPLPCGRSNASIGGTEIDVILIKGCARTVVRHESSYPFVFARQSPFTLLSAPRRIMVKQCGRGAHSAPPVLTRASSIASPQQLYLL